MSKVTRRLQVTIPKAVAARCGIRPGDEVRWESLPGGVLLVAATSPRHRLTPEERLELFRRQTERIRRIQGKRRWPRSKDRGWAREDLYGGRGLSR